MTLTTFTFLLMAMVFVVQTASLIMMRKIDENARRTAQLINDTLKMQAQTMHELIQRVGLLERRMKARAGNEGG
jgi:ABC-type proline/glycine betaine transport system ATPase subunit